MHPTPALPFRSLASLLRNPPRSDPEVWSRKA
jgi:hypothetical protein